MCRIKERKGWAWWMNDGEMNLEEEEEEKR